MAVQMTTPIHVPSHFSASQITLARDDMALYGITYGLRVKGNMSLQAARGIGTEDGVAYGLKNPNAEIEECIDIGLQSFNEKTAFTALGMELRQRQRDVLAGYETSRTLYPGCVRVGSEALRPFGPPTGHGEKVEVSLEGISVPFIGYKDFSYAELGYSVDLKTTERMPSKIINDHKLQMAIYNKASNNQRQRIAYCSPKEAVIFDLSQDDAREAILEATHVAKILLERINAASTWEEFIRSEIPDFTSFRWHESARQKAVELFGF